MGGSPLDDAHRHQHVKVVYYLGARGASTGSLNANDALIAAVGNPGAFRSKFESDICDPMLNNKYSKRRLGIFHGLPPRLTSCGIGVPGGMGTAGSIGGTGTGIAHKVGCKCRKLACLWKYCECFGASTWCSMNCCCIGCMNRAPGGGSTRGHPVAWGVVDHRALPLWPPCVIAFGN